MFGSGGHLLWREPAKADIAFCPYCGIMNENSATAYSHARKHLGITLLCGGCYGKLYKVPQHLSSYHMKSCRPCLMNRPEGSRMKWEEEVASYHSRLLPTQTDCSLGLRGSPSAETPGLFLLWRPLVSFLSFEIFGLCFMLFDFWRLSLHTFR